MKILGIDPGSRLTGYAVLDCDSRGAVRSVVHGVLRVEKAGDESADRLVAVFEGISSLIEEHQPQVLSIERVFFAKNAVSALKLGQARGAALVAARLGGLEIAEYSPTEVKRAVTGHGQADKQQVQKTVELILKQDLGKRGAVNTQFATFDASDAVALAICHGRQAKGLQGKVAAQPSPWAQALKEVERSKAGRKNLSMAQMLTQGRKK